MRNFSIAISDIFSNAWRNRHLIAQLTSREVLGRYRGSFMGLAWSFFHPVLMLAVYTFVFSSIFKARWNNVDVNTANFAIVLFVGMIIHALFAECANRAPNLILTHPNYVKKVIFPLEILPIVSLGAALFHCCVSLCVLIAAIAISNSALHWTSLLIPLIIAPLTLVILGVSWLLASLGVFIRDIGQSIGIVTTIMMFLSPTFYPISALPERYQHWMMANPITFIIEQARAVLIWGQQPNWTGLAIYYAIAIAIAWCGYAWFQKTRKGFADVL